jgi:protein TonB
MNPTNEARRVPKAVEPAAPRVLAFPMRAADQVAVAGHQNWRTFEDDSRRRNPQRTRYWLLAVIVHLAVAALFLIELNRPEDKPLEEATIEMVAPPALPVAKPPPPKAVEVKEPPKPHPTVQRTIPKPAPKLRPPTPQAIAAPQMPPLPREAPPPPPVPSQPAPPADFVGKLYAHLDANKRYPRDLRMAHIGGTVMLRFAMNHQGRVVSYKIEQSSGNARLDAEVSAMIERAQPLPIPPPDMADPQEIVIPIRFSTR